MDWLRARGPTLMAVVNLNTDSFSDPRDEVDLPGRLAAARSAVDAGAGIVDIGAQSAALAAALVDGDRQRDLLVPVVEALVADGVPVSVDTYEPVAAAAVVRAGATVLNDFSGSPHRRTIEEVAATGAAYVLTHNPVGPRQRQTDPTAYEDVVDDVLAFFDRSLRTLEDWGLPPHRVLLDPGVDVAKTPAQTLALLRGRDRVRAATDQPLLWAVGRKDVLGALTGRGPAERDAATLALVGAFADHDRTVLRVHDTAACSDVLRVADALVGRVELEPGRLLDDALRREG